MQQRVCGEGGLAPGSRSQLCHVQPEASDSDISPGTKAAEAGRGPQGCGTRRTQPAAGGSRARPRTGAGSPPRPLTWLWAEGGGAWGPGAPAVLSPS